MTLATEKRTLLTVITESVIEKNLTRDLNQLGVRGYTIVDARGQGRRGVRSAGLGETSKTSILTACSS